MHGKASFLWDEDADRPADMSRIIQAVESLPSADQMRVLRLIELLADMPDCSYDPGVRQVMQLLSGFRLLSRQECRFRVDTAIAYLEAERNDEFGDDSPDFAYETH